MQQTVHVVAKTSHCGFGIKTVHGCSGHAMIHCPPVHSYSLSAVWLHGQPHGA